MINRRRLSRQLATVIDYKPCFGLFSVATAGFSILSECVLSCWHLAYRYAYSDSVHPFTRLSLFATRTPALMCASNATAVRVSRLGQNQTVASIWVEGAWQCCVELSRQGLGESNDFFGGGKRVFAGHGLNLRDARIRPQTRARHAQCVPAGHPTPMPYTSSARLPASNKPVCEQNCERARTVGSTAQNRPRLV